MKAKRLAFFEKDLIPWETEFEMHDFYKSLFQLHATHPALRGGDKNVATHRVRTTADENIFAFLRKNGDAEVLVIINLSYTSPVLFGISDPVVSGVFTELFSGIDHDFGQHSSFEMDAWDYKVFVK